MCGDQQLQHPVSQMMPLGRWRADWRGHDASHPRDSSDLEAPGTSLNPHPTGLTKVHARPLEIWNSGISAWAGRVAGKDQAGKSWVLAENC